MAPSIPPIRSPWRRRTARRPAAAVPGRKARPELEVLEGRNLPTIVFTPQFGGGDAMIQGYAPDGMQHPTVNLVFSGTYWSTAQGQQDEKAMIGATQSILGGPYLSGLNQYGSDGRASFGISWNDPTEVNRSDTSSQPAAPGYWDMQEFLQQSIYINPGVHTLETAPIYVVISDPVAAAPYSRGFNNQAYYYTNHPWSIENIDYIWIDPGYLSKQGQGVWIDGCTAVLSHELADLTSDPNGILPVQVPTAAPGGGFQGQVCDGEPNVGYWYRLNGVAVQAYWSNQDKAFIVPDVPYGSANSQSFDLGAIWKNGQFSPTTARYNLLVQGDQLGVNYADSIQIGGNNNANASVTLNNANATFDQGTINSIRVDTKGGANTVQVLGLPRGVTLDVDSTSYGSTNAIHIGANGSLSGIQGTVNISNTSGQSSVVIDDSSDGARDIIVTDHSVVYEDPSSQQAALATINYQAVVQQNGTTVGVTALTLDDADAPNLIDVLSVGSLTDTSLKWYAPDLLIGPAKNQVQFI
jgi:hypothetical protein